MGNRGGESAASRPGAIASFSAVAHINIIQAFDGTIVPCWPTLIADSFELIALLGKAIFHVSTSVIENAPVCRLPQAHGVLGGDDGVRGKIGWHL